MKGFANIRQVSSKMILAGIATIVAAATVSAIAAPVGSADVSTTVGYAYNAQYWADGQECHIYRTGVHSGVLTVTPHFDILGNRALPVNALLQRVWVKPAMYASLSPNGPWTYLVEEMPWRTAWAASNYHTAWFNYDGFTPYNGGDNFNYPVDDYSPRVYYRLRYNYFWSEVANRGIPSGSATLWSPTAC